MSERIIGIFPLPIVLFPGAPQLLHIFEPRYRQLLRDCLAGDRRFGLSYVDPSGPDPGSPAPGDVGCLAYVQTVQDLDDGRSNILCLGEDRFVLEEYVDTDRLYRTARVRFFRDEPSGGADLADLACVVRETFKKVAAGMRALQGQVGEPDELPDNPADLSLHIAAALDLDPGQKQDLLQLRSAETRLRRLLGFLHDVRDQLTRRVEQGLLQRRNGKRSRNSRASADS